MNIIKADVIEKNFYEDNRLPFLPYLNLKIWDMMQDMYTHYVAYDDTREDAFTDEEKIQLSEIKTDIFFKNLHEFFGLDENATFENRYQARAIIFDLYHKEFQPLTGARCDVASRKHERFLAMKKIFKEMNLGQYLKESK